jgi:hypothetical protein
MNLNTSVNEYAVPLHACNGYRHDEHYWAYVRHKTMTGIGPYYDWLRSMMKEKP